MKPSDDARLQADQHNELTEEALVEGGKAEGHWPHGQHGPVHDQGFDRTHQGAPRADDRSQYTGQSAYGSLDEAGAATEHQDSEHRRTRSGQQGDFGEASYGGERGENERGGMSSYGNSSGSRYAIDNEPGTMARTASSPLSQEGAAKGAAPASTDVGQYAGEYDDVSHSPGEGGVPPRATPATRSPEGERKGLDLRSDERLREEIQQRLMEHPHLELRDVSVAVNGGRVRLEGSVPERRMKHAIEDLADSVNGVARVENLMEVQRREDAVSTFASGYTAGQAYAAAGDVSRDPNDTGAATFGVASAKAAADKQKEAEENKAADKKEGKV